MISPIFASQVEERFPKEKDSFHDFLKRMEDFDAYSPNVKNISTRKILTQTFSNPYLVKCYYVQHATTDRHKNDIDFATFTMLFDAIFKQGLARPEKEHVPY